MITQSKKFMSDTPHKTTTLIKEDDYMIYILSKIIYPSSKTKTLGLAIYKKTCEISQLNSESIDLIFNDSNDKFIESLANIGFIKLCDFLCFVYATSKDIEFKCKILGNKYPYQIFKLKNLQYIVISPFFDIFTKTKIKNEFDKFKQYLLTHELYFSILPYKFNLDISEQLHIFKFNNFDYRIEQNFVFNKKFTLPQTDKIINPLVSGMCKQILLCEFEDYSVKLNIAMRYKKLENHYLLETELSIFLNVPQLNFIYQNMIYSLHYNDNNEKEIDFLSEIISKKPVNKDDNKYKELIGGVILNIKEKNDSSELETKLKEKLGEKYEIYSFEKNKYDDLSNQIDNMKYIFELIGFNCVRNKDNTSNQNKKIIIIGDNNENIFMMIEIICNKLLNVFIDKEKLINRNEINPKFKDKLSKYIHNFESKITKLDQVQSLSKYELIDNDFGYNKNCNSSTKSVKNSINLENLQNLYSPEKIKTNENNEDECIKDNEKEMKENININLKNNDTESDINFIMNDKIINIDNINIDNINIENDYDTLESTNINNIMNSNANNLSNNISLHSSLSSTSKNELKPKKTLLYIATYNVNALDTETIKLTDLNPFLFPKKIHEYFTKDNFPTFYCIGLEEVIKLNAKNVIINPKSRGEVWEEKITHELKYKYNYILQYKEHLVGVLFLFFVKASEIKYVKNIRSELLKSGFLGSFGNKGCIFFEFQYRGNNYGFCSGHLCAGQKEKNFLERKENFKSILNFKVDKNPKEFYRNNFYFIFGDLNFRAKSFKLAQLQNHIKILITNGEFSVEGRKKSLRYSMNPPTKMKTVSKKDKMNRFSSENLFKTPTAMIKNIINKDNKEISDKIMDEEIFEKYFLKEFLDEEELKQFKEELEMFCIDECTINFTPTYKYYKNSDYYNLEKRVPSWTDRILFKKNDYITPLFYDKINLNYSDHKPVFALFEISYEEK